jgi:signal transduction histidine kinase
LKFAGPGGRVRVATRVGVGSQAEIVVSDTGPGVPVEERDRIFDHGVRLERDVGIGGTGIGLAVVRELVVVHHGGTVRVGDAEGGGAEFVVSLPLDRRSRARDGGAASRELPSSGRIRAGDAR